MLRREFFAAAPLALTEGARLVEYYHDSGQVPEWNRYEGRAELEAILTPHFERESDLHKAVMHAWSYTRAGWTNIGVWGEKGARLGRLVGVNPETGRVEFLPPEAK